jgi:hypothetical protein
VAKDVVEDVGFLEIIQLLLGSDEGTGRKAPIGEVIEENVIGNELGHRNDAPAGNLFKSVTQLFHVRNAAVGQRQRRCHGEEFVTRAALQNSV